jgi:DNA invertase Pin-like site-specific DNA recombinase
MQPYAYLYTRMSSAEQLKGDSRRRQEVSGRARAQQLGLEVREINDHGVSAYRGTNALFGELADFLISLRNGEVAAGSYLIVESLDRLSRDDLTKALELFISIVNAGVTLITLFDDKTYSSATLAADSFGIMFALMQFATAGEESKKKSQRLAAAWKAKKDNSRATNEPLSAMVPAWLVLDRENKKILPVPERVAIVREIFQLSISGYGCASIARLLNERQVPVWRPRNGVSGEWGESYIKKILANRAVLGEYRPHKNVVSTNYKTGTAPDGEPLIGYYPAVVDEITFQQAADAGRSRLVNGAGRKGPGYTNLFTGLLKCRCGAGVRYIDKGSPPKGGQYLVCASGVRSGRCKLPHVRYKTFEEVLLQHLEGLNIAKAMGTESSQSKRVQLEREQTACEIDLQRVQAKQINLLAVLSTDGGKDIAFISRAASECQTEEAVLRQKIEGLAAEIRRIDRSNPESYKALLDELLYKLKAALPEERQHLKRLLATEIKKAVSSITLSFEPLGPDSYSVDGDADLGLGHVATIDYHSNMTQVLSLTTSKDLKLRWSKQQKLLKQRSTEKSDLSS